MEVEGLLRLFPWAGLSYMLLLSGTLEIRGAEIYTVPGLPLWLNVPNCPQVSDSDTIEWEDEAARLGKWKKTPSYYTYCNSTLCKIHPNGTLTLHKPKEMTKKYRVKVYNSAGSLKCNENVTVIMEEELQPPVLSYNCTSAGASVYCVTSARNTVNLTLSWSTKSQTTGEKSIGRNIKEKSYPVRCVVSNRAHESKETVTINCPEEDVEINRPQTTTVQRQLPPPVGQSSTGPLSSGIQGDGTDHGLIQKPATPHRPGEPTPGGRKGKQTRSQRLPASAPGQTATTCEAPAPPQSRPALPGNHPSEQAPRPQPRTKSKPPRQSRKSRL
ncbi:T-cell surface antigen CD2 isoform X3 [Phyllobates terribilis]|uniref:T-cell surface antigen CD2 isoform X3 n=1 Tax=Phyllobates terribilis TaxID=111132 RepID=UPI003CCAD95A